jgi:hypothetical protein
MLPKAMCVPDRLVLFLAILGHVGAIADNYSVPEHAQIAGGHQKYLRPDIFSQHCANFHPLEFWCKNI